MNRKELDLYWQLKSKQAEKKERDYKQHNVIDDSFKNIVPMYPNGNKQINAAAVL